MRSEETPRASWLLRLLASLGVVRPPIENEAANDDCEEERDDE